MAMSTLLSLGASSKELGDSVSKKQGQPGVHPLPGSTWVSNFYIAAETKLNNDPANHRLCSTENKAISYVCRYLGWPVVYMYIC